MSAGPPPTLHDRDVDEGFPVRRLLARIVQANMIFVGGCFFLMMLEESRDSVESYFFGYRRHGETFLECIADQYETAFEDAAEWTFDLFDDSPVILAGLSIPGTLGGVGWYLLGRWYESVLIKKRREALAAQAEARNSPLKSANPALHCPALTGTKGGL